MTDTTGNAKRDTNEHARLEFLAPFLMGVGIGAIFAALMSMGKSIVVGLVIAGVGACIAVIGGYLNFSRTDN